MLLTRLEINSQTLKIAKAPLHVVTPSATKAYDGTPLTYSGEGGAYDFTDVEWMLEAGQLDQYDGPTVLYDLFDSFDGEWFTVTGSQTEIGRSYNTVEFTDEVWRELQKNYDVEMHLGTLTVKAPEDTLAILAPSGSKMYDGKPMDLTNAQIIVDGLPEGFTVQAKVLDGARTDAGRTTTKIDPASVKVLDQDGKDVTNAYRGSLVLANGEIFIERAVLFVNTFDATKEADGSPLTAGGEMSGLVNGETATLRTTGSQTAVGSSQNEYTISWNGTAKSYNYRVITGELGTLTVTNASTSGGGASNAGGDTGGSADSGAGNVVYTGGTANTTNYTGTTTSPTSATATGTSTSAGRLPASNNSNSSNNNLNPTIEKIAQGMQNLEQFLRGEELTGLLAPAAGTAGLQEEILAEEETPLGVFDAPVDCWVHWYSILGLLVTAIYGAVVMFFRRAYTYELESREANILGVPVGLAEPQIPAGTSGHAGREA